MVRPHLAAIEAFSQRDRWAQITPQDQKTLIDDLAQLPHGLPSEKPETRRFDLLCLQMQLSILKQTPNFNQLRDKIRDLLGNLETKTTIPMVKTQLPLITEALTESWWATVTVPQIETLRSQLRELMQFIDRDA
ncbi:MAG: heavy metal transporter, partial [Limnothrix sp. RL_2_0]|nr:heavy metal transporter [Limnothrix sp. RL_2_0]